MLNFIKKKIALIWAKKHIEKSKGFKGNAIQDQQDLLLDLVKTAEKTLFGREHQFEAIKSIGDFQKNNWNDFVLYNILNESRVSIKP